MPQKSRNVHCYLTLSMLLHLNNPTNANTPTFKHGLVVLKSCRCCRCSCTQISHSRTAQQCHGSRSRALRAGPGTASSGPYSEADAAVQRDKTVRYACMRRCSGALKVCKVCTDMPQAESSTWTRATQRSHLASVVSVPSSPTLITRLPHGRNSIRSPSRSSLRNTSSAI